MAYEKPQILAQNNASGSYAAGCPAKDQGHNTVGSTGCVPCERTE